MKISFHIENTTSKSMGNYENKTIIFIPSTTISTYIACTMQIINGRKKT